MGMEVTSALVSQGCEVSMVFPDVCFMERLMPPELAAHYESAFQSKGVSISKGEGNFVDRFEETDGAISVVMKNGNVHTGEAIFVGIGGRPVTNIYGDALETDQTARGISV